MGLFSRKPPPDLPQRDDLQRALEGVDPKDADRIRSKRHLAEACAQLPETSTVRAVLDGVITEPHTTDDGLLAVTEEAVTYQGSHSGSMTFPLAAIQQAEMISKGTLRIGWDDTAPGVSALPGREAADHLDFSIRAKPESASFFVDQVRRATTKS